MSIRITLPERLTRTTTIETEIDPKAFVHIPGTNKLISKRVGYKGQDFYDTVQTVETTSAYVIAPPSIFMPHYARVCRAALQEDIILKDGTKELFDRRATDELYEYLSTEACAWLDVYFERTNQGLFVATDHRFIKGKVQPQTWQPLETCVMEDGIVNLIFNSQGIPIQRSEKPEYYRGKKIRYLSIRDDSVGGFGANRGLTTLYYDRDPQLSDPVLGVFLIAEVPKN